MLRLQAPGVTELSIPLPRWLTETVPADEREAAEAKFHAALREVWGGPPRYEEKADRFAPPRGAEYAVGTTARVRLLLRTAALYNSQSGSMSRLSEDCGLHPRTLSTYSVSRNAIPAEVARSIENLVGRHVLPREVLNPVIFGDG